MTCPICAATAAPAFRSRFVDVAKCQDSTCGHLFASSTTPMAGVQSHDADAEWATYAQRNERLVRFLRRSSVVGPGFATLDFGSGSGHLIAGIVHAEPTLVATCIEAEAASANRLRGLGLHVVDDIDLVEAGAYDSVLLTEVIEHLDAPVEVLSKVVARLRPGGRIFITTPAGETSRGSRATNAYDTPEHVQFFTERSLQLAARRAGLAPLRFRVVGAMYPAGPGVRGKAVYAVKRALRPFRDFALGRRHLVAVGERLA